MNLFRKRKVLSLHEWLEIACGKLVKSSRERIQAEIESHYAEALKAHQEDGMPKWEAHLAALTELGDARDAGKRFCREHLTEQEAQIVAQCDRQARNMVALLISYLVVGSLLLLVPHKKAPELWILSVAFVYAFFETIRFTVARRGGPNASRNLLLMQALYHSGGCIAFIILFYDSVAARITLELCFIPLFLLTVRFLRIWMKLGKAGTLLKHATPPASPEPDA